MGPPYEKKEVAGNWFGFAQGDVYLYRVRLGLPNAGSGAYQASLEKSSSVFEVQEWIITERAHLSIHMKPNAGVTRIEGHLITEGMFSAVVYGSSGWSNSVTFYKEDPFERRLKELREKMNGSVP